MTDEWIYRLDRQALWPYSCGVNHGIDDSDPFGVAALFLAQSLAHKFDCAAEVDALVAELVSVDTPSSPSESVSTIVAPIDDLLDRIELQTGLIELLEALLRLGVDSPPRSDVAERLYRAVLWTMMRHDPAGTTPRVLAILHDATPGGRVTASSWPPHEFFAAALLLVYLGGLAARDELVDLVEAARDLGYPALAFVLEWYLDHRHSIPAR